MPKNSPAKLVPLRPDRPTSASLSDGRRSAPSESKSVAARIVLSTSAAERFVRAITNGVDRYILVTADGSLSLPRSGLRLVRVNPKTRSGSCQRKAYVVDWASSMICERQQSRRDLAHRTAVARRPARGEWTFGNARATCRACMAARRDPAHGTRQCAHGVRLHAARKRLAAIGLRSRAAIDRATASRPTDS